VTTALEELLLRHVEAGTVPGAVALLGSGDVEVVAAGMASTDGEPMRADAIMRIQSMTKAIISVAALRLVEAERLGLDQSLEQWLPELADRRVLSSPTAALDDTVPAQRAITLRHLLTNASGYGMAIVDSPLQNAMAENGTEAGPAPVSLSAGARPVQDAGKLLPRLLGRDGLGIRRGCADEGPAARPLRLVRRSGHQLLR
jgi:CubicO group peptidase (beta-lactamase class C family)